MLRAIQLALAASVLSVAAIAAITIARDPEAGVVAGDPGGRVAQVDPGGPAWRNGVRLGDVVISLTSEDAPGGWRLVSSDGHVDRITAASSFGEVHASYAGWTIVGIAVAVLTAIVAFRGLPLGAAVTPVAIAFVAEPVFFAGSVLATLLGGLAVYAAGGASGVAFVPTGHDTRSSARLRRQLTRAMAIVGALLAAAWVGAVATGSAIFDALDAARWPVAVAFGVVGSLLTVDVDRARAAFIGDRGPAFLDLAYGAIAVSLMLLAAVVLRVELLVVAGAGILAIVAYPSWRRFAFQAFDRFVTADARRDAAILAVEGERARLAREIHDVPLQDLAAAIRGLESIPGTGPGIALVRRASGNLRDVVNVLHPPALEDLGLATAIEDLVLAQRQSGGSASITVDLDDLTSTMRPPEDVELAAFRVTQQAIANAIEHAGSSTVSVTGLVSVASVSITIADDGVGITTDAVRTARANGHFGIDTMRERARLVGADLVVGAGSPGTTVAFVWESAS